MNWRWSTRRQTLAFGSSWNSKGLISVIHSDNLTIQLSEAIELRFDWYDIIPILSPFIDIQVEEFKYADLSAKLIAEKIAFQLTKRMPYRRVVLFAIEKAMTSGAKGVKIILGGRINGAEISRREKFSQGKVPLSTIKSKIDYAECPSLTRSGYIGVKVYLCLG